VSTSGDTTPALVFIGGALCSNSTVATLDATLSSVSCRVPPGVQTQSVTVLQSGSVPVQQNMSITYTNCTLGWAPFPTSSSVSCAPCLVGLFAEEGSSGCR
jgi:hypothetical protein